MRSYKISTKQLESIQAKQGLSPEQVAEIAKLQSAVVGLDKKSSNFKLINERIGEILCAITSRAYMIILVNVTKRIHKLFSTMPTSAGNYNQMIELAEGLLKSTIQAQKMAPVAEPSFTVDLGQPLKFADDPKEEEAVKLVA